VLQLTPSLEVKIGVTLAIGFAVLLSISWVQYQSTAQVARAMNWVDHTHQVIGLIDKTLLSATRTQSIARGYAVTGDPAVLAPRDAAISTL